MQEPQIAPERTLGISFAYWNGFFDANCYDCFIANTGEYIIEVTETDKQGIYFARFNALEGKNLTAMTEINFYLKASQDLDATLPINPRETAQRDHDEIQRLLAENARLIHFIKIVIDVSPLHSFEVYSEIERESIFNQMIELGANAELLIKELS